MNAGYVSGERACALVGRIAGRIEEVVVPLLGNYGCAGMGKIRGWWLGNFKLEVDCTLGEGELRSDCPPTRRGR